jgi:hypothetical protein
MIVIRGVRDRVNVGFDITYNTRIKTEKKFWLCKHFCKENFLGLIFFKFLVLSNRNIANVI